MSDYSISARLKVDDSDLRRVRREVWMLAKDFAGLAAGIKKSFGSMAIGVRTSMRTSVDGSISEGRRLDRYMAGLARENERRVSRMATLQTRAMFATARASSGNASASVRSMLAAERSIDAQIAALANPRKQQTAESVGARYGGGQEEGGWSMFGANVAAGALLRVVDYSVAAIGRWTSGLVDSAKQMMETQRELQVTRVGIASLYVAGGSDVPGAMTRSAGTMTALRRQAAEGIGGLTDYTKAYQTLYTPMTMAGRSEADILKMTRLTIAAGGAMEGKLGIRTAPVDVLQALGKGATDAQTRILANVIRGGGKSLDEFNKMDQAKKLEFLMVALERWEPAAKMMGKTVDSMEETIKDWRDNVFGVALSARAADTYSRSLERQITLMKDNEIALTNYNDILGISFDVLAQFRQGMTEARAVADAATASSKASVHQALRAGGGMEMLAKYLGSGPELLKNFYVGLDYATNALISFGSRAAATVGLMLSLKDPKYRGNPSAIFGDLGEIWYHMPGDQFNMEAEANANPDGGVPTWGNTPTALGSAIAKGMQQHARRDRLDINARVEWGNPRQMALSMEDMLTSVAQRAYAVRLEPDSLAAYPG